MQGIEMSDYVNDQPTSRKRGTGNLQKTERSLLQRLLLSFGLLCVIQATLNISLRLAFYKSRTPSDCNVTSVGANNAKVKKEEPRHCNDLQERFNALTADRNLLQNRISQLKNDIKRLEEDKTRLTIQVADLNGCASSLRCPTGWSEVNLRCYFLSSEGRTWLGGRSYCQSQGADLVVINSEQEQRALYRLNRDEYLLFWIGLHVTNGTFTWVDGSTLSKTFWQKGEPSRNPPGREEDCVEMYHELPVLTTWNNAPCGAKRPWMCERELCVPPP